MVIICTVGQLECTRNIVYVHNMNSHHYQHCRIGKKTKSRYCSNGGGGNGLFITGIFLFNYLW